MAIMVLAGCSSAPSPAETAPTLGLTLEQARQHLHDAGIPCGDSSDGPSGPYMQCDGEVGVVSDSFISFEVGSHVPVKDGSCYPDGNEPDPTPPNLKVLGFYGTDFIVTWVSAEEVTDANINAINAEARRGLEPVGEALGIAQTPISYADFCGLS